jgi:hypothetical protein
VHMRNPWNRVATLFLRLQITVSDEDQSRAMIQSERMLDEKSLLHLMNDAMVGLKIGALLRLVDWLLGDGSLTLPVGAAAMRSSEMGFRRCYRARGAAFTRAAAMFFAVLVAAVAAICGTSRDALASAGCSAVNAGGFNVSAGSFGTKTVGDFTVGDNVTFIIASRNSGSWILRTAGFNNLDGSPIFATNASQTKSYTITGGNQDTTLTQYSGGITVTASCTVATAPTVISISPTSGPSGGSSVTIIGTGFTGVTSVNFGSNAASYTVNSDSSITGTLPAGSGTVDVTVTTPGGTSATNPADHFTYTATPGATPVTAAPSTLPAPIILPRPDPRRRSPQSHPKPTAPTAPQSPGQTSPTLQR